MAISSIPLGVGSAGGLPIEAAPQRVWNMYPIVSPASKENIAWKGTPGYNLWGSVGGVGRAMTVHKGNIYFIVDSTVYRATSSSSISSVGNVDSSINKASMASDGFNLLVADGQRMWYFDSSSDAMKEVSIPFDGPVNVIFHDGHFIARESGTGKFWISDKYDGLTWDALQFATAEDKPDDLRYIHSDKYLWLFGDYTTQAYINTGLSFPFSPTQQSTMRYGIVGDTASIVDNSTMWLARTEYGGLKVIKVQGFQPLPVSTSEINNEISRFTTVDDAYSFSLEWMGQEWYVLTFPTEDRTFVFSSSGLWFEWGQYDNTTDKLDQIGFADFVYWRNQYLCLGTDGNIYELDEDDYQHNGSEMVSQIISPVIHTDQQRVFFHRLIYDMRTGVGPNNDESEIMTCFSYDGGNTYGSWMNRSLGIEGDYQKRVQWHKLGSGYDIVIKSRITDNCPRHIITATLDVDVYASYLDRRYQRIGIPSFEA